MDNLACLWSRASFFGFWLSHKLYSGCPHDNFQAEHGSTVRFGMHAPSECGDFWYRWLPTDRHFIDNYEITDEMVNGIRREVTAVSDYFDRPILFKNMNAGLRLRLLHKCFPKAKFIFICRDHRFIVKSILNVRRTRRIKPNELWSLKPNDYEELLNLPELDMVIAQVYAIEQQIRADLSLFPPEQRCVVHYEKFSRDLVDMLGRFIGARKRSAGSLPVFKKDSPALLQSSYRLEFEAAMRRFSMVNRAVSRAT